LAIKRHSQFTYIWSWGMNDSEQSASLNVSYFLDY
jgi:hypothetical protein